MSIVDKRFSKDATFEEICPAEFDTWEAVDKFVRFAKNEHYHPIVKRSSINVKTYNKSVSNPILRLPTDARLRKVMYICTHGWKRDRQGIHQRVRDVRFLGCKFSFSVIAKPCIESQKGWKIERRIKFAVHNHRVSKMHHLALPENRRIPSLDFVKQSIAISGKNSLTRHSLEEQYGVFVTGKDYQNIRARLRADERQGSSEDELLYQFGREFKSLHKNNVFKVIVGGVNQIRSIIVQSHCDKDIFNHHPEVLLMDSTHCINRAGYNCFGIMCMDLSGHGQLIRTTLLADACADNLECILATFKENNLRWKDVQVIVVDKDQSEIDTIRRCFPHVNITLCQFHVIKWFKGVLPKYGIVSADKDRVLEKLSQMMYAPKVELYEALKKDLFRMNDKHHPFHAYFEKNWDNISPMWCSYHRNVVPQFRKSNKQ